MINNNDLINDFIWLIFSIIIALIYALSYILYDKLPIFKKIGNFLLLIAFVKEDKKYLILFAFGMLLIIVILSINFVQKMLVV